MDLAGLRRSARARYGLEYSGAEDAVFTGPLLNELINEAHRELAAASLCYRQTQLYDLPLGAGGVSTVALECNVIEIDPRSVRVRAGGRWRRVGRVEEAQALYDRGPLRETANGAPSLFYLRTGDALDAHRVLEFAPGARAATPGGVELAAYIYPAPMSEDSHAPALQPAEHTKLLPFICWKMAEHEAGRGRRDAPVGYWRSRAEEAATELKRLIERFRRPGPREVRIRAYDDC
jgi:hypothetical protein